MLQKISIGSMQGKSIGDRLSVTILGMGLLLGDLSLNPVHAFPVLGNSNHQSVVTETNADKAKPSATSTDLSISKAEKLFDQGKFQESLQQYQQVLNIYRQQGDRLGESIALTGIGMAQVSLRQETDAIASLQKALALLQAPAATLSNNDKQLYRKAEGETKYQLGRAYINLEQYVKSLPLLEESLKIRQEVGDRYREGKTLATIGIVYVKKYEFPRSVEYFENGLKISIAEKNRASEGQTLFYLASIYSLLGQKEQALALVRQSGKAYQALDNPLGQASALNLEGNILSLSLEYKQVAQLNLQALELVRQVGDRPREAEILSAVATAYRNLGTYPQALEFYVQSHKIYQELGDRAGQGMILKNIADVRLAQGLNREALTIYEQARAIYEDLTKDANAKPSDRQTLAGILTGQGSLYTSFSQYPKAITTLKEAQALYQSLGDRQGKGVASLYLAQVYLQLEDREKISDILKELPELTKNSPQLRQMAESLVGLANNNSLKSTNPQAQLKSVLSLLEFFKQSGDRKSEAAMMLQASGLYFELKQIDKTITFNQQALDIYREIGDRSGAADALYQLGLSYALSNRVDKAFVAFQAALLFAREVGNRNQESKLLGNIGSILENQYPELAIAFYKQSLSTGQKVVKVGRKEFYKR